MSLASVIKDPDAVLPYSINWASADGTNDGSSADTGWLQGETIATSTWAVSGSDSTLVVDSDDNSDTVTTVVLSGGTLNRKYSVTNSVTTNLGYSDDRTITITVTQR